MTKRDPLIHRVVVEAVNGLTDLLSVERKRVPEVVIRDAQRLESIIFSGYDCYFEGDELPGIVNWSGAQGKVLSDIATYLPRSTLSDVRSL